MTMKSIKLLIASLCVTGIVSCGVASCGNDDDPEAPVWNGIKSPDDAKVTGTLSGDFDIDNPSPGSSATATLSAFPGSLKSFLDLQKQIGGDPAGAAVLPLVGMEVYYQRGSKIGLECIKSACTESTFIYIQTEIFRFGVVERRADPGGAPRRTTLFRRQQLVELLCLCKEDSLRPNFQRTGVTPNTFVYLCTAGELHHVFDEVAVLVK